MPSPASRSLEHRSSLAAFGAVVVVAAVLGVSSARAQAPVTAASVVAAEESPNPFADRFPNAVLTTHEGKRVRFYDDLLKGKIVMINFMYATCKGR